MNIQQVLQVHGYDVINIYPYGSKVYGTNPNGDDDYIVVVEGNNIENQIIDKDIDVTIYSLDVFNNLIENHEISVLECIFLPKDILISDNKDFNFTLDLEKLRSSLSRKSSNSFVKAKKKLTIEKDFDSYVAKKSLFHSLRIIMFGIQIAKYGKIINYSEANDLWNDIINNPINDWDYYKSNYQPIYNHLKSEFKKFAPKEII